MPVPIIFLTEPSTLLPSPLSPEFMSSHISHQKMEILFMSVILIIVFFVVFIFHCFQYQVRRNQTRTLDIERQSHATHAMRIFARLQAEIILQRQAAQSNAAGHEETSSAAMAVAYKDVIKTSEKGDCCAICIEGFEEEDICGVVESCGHCFHKDCMDQWLRIESRCPLCRCLVHVVSNNNNNNSQENQA